MANNKNNFILKNVELMWCRLSKDNPYPPYEKSGIPYWGVAIKTTDKLVAGKWQKKYNLNVKRKEYEDEIYYTALLKQPVKTIDGRDLKCPVVVDAKLKPFDANTVGNGSIGNVSVYQYEYSRGKWASKIQGVQLVKVYLYKPVDKDNLNDFEELDENTKVDKPKESIKRSKSPKGTFKQKSIEEELEKINAEFNNDLDDDEDVVF